MCQSLLISLYHIVAINHKNSITAQCVDYLVLFRFPSNIGKFALQMSIFAESSVKLSISSYTHIYP